MTETIITGIVAILVCTVNNYYQSNKTQALIEYKLDELTRRVDKHNNLNYQCYIHPFRIFLKNLKLCSSFADLSHEIAI